MHMDEGQSLGLQIDYELLDFDLLPEGPARLAAVLDQAEQRGFTGLNVTYPSKQAVIPLLHELSPEARALHSVNTVLFRGGRRIGHNTDWWGFAESFRRELPDVARGRVVQFGAGGAGSAVGYALLTQGVGELAIVDTDHARAEKLACLLAGRFGTGRARARQDVSEAVRTADGVVNATPLGMARYPGTAFCAKLLGPGLWVADIVYFPLETQLLREARARGTSGSSRRKLSAKPHQSVLCPIARPASKTTVLTAPSARASGAMPSRKGMIACLAGWVTLRPANPKRLAAVRSSGKATRVSPSASRSTSLYT